ncbi:MAG TPA: alcohol dehydrogenase catalytic domain-containing protein, partial [Acidimicrobiales bacterium]|nr:alcohol dehydrogenase catalytic domain-containing protein [Acidimicrobiales bacterium]
MRAVLSNEPGGPETLVVADVPAPEPGPGEVVVDVEAVAVNFPDVLIIEDLYQFKPRRPFAPGAEVAGRVSAVGEGVTTPAIGDRVLAVPGFGGMVEQLAVKA